MFERFTQRARHVVVLAQEEARTLKHHHIGTEHVLLGLLGEPDGLGGQVLVTFGLSLAQAREQVAEQVRPGKKAVDGHIPFTPRSKKVLEQALRAAMSLGHTYIGTEHVLLGLLRDPDGVGAQIIAERVGDLGLVRQAVLDGLPAPEASPGPRWVRTPDPDAVAGPGRGEEVRTTPAADGSLNAAARIAGAQPVGSHHLMLAALSDPRSAAARALAGAGIDLDHARRALREVDITGTDDEPPEEAGRRRMILRTSGDTLILEISDPTLLDLARAAMASLRPDDAPPGTIPGDLAVAAGLATVWTALRTSLEDVRRRASARGPGTETSGGPADHARRPGPDATGDAQEGDAAG